MSEYGLCSGPSPTDPAVVGDGSGYGNGGALCSAINTACKNSELQRDNYWCNTDYSGATSYRWRYDFYYSYFNTDEYNSNRVRAVFAY